MNKVDQIYERSKNPLEFSKNYFSYLSTVFDSLNHDHIQDFINLIIDTRERGNRLLFIGNGGSAATASHFANDIGYGTRCYDKPFKCLSLTDNNAVMTALGNDDGYDMIFKRQLQNLMEPGDVIVAITASGNSPNLLEAVEYANSKGNHTVGLLGFSGGKLKDMVKSYIHIETAHGEYGPVEDLHMILDHLVGNYLLRYVK